MTQADKGKAALERMRRLRGQGAAKFILLYGGGLVGGGMTLLFSVAMWLIAGPGVPFLKVFGYSLPFVLLGLLFGVQMWWMLGRGLARVDGMLAQQEADVARAKAGHSRRLDQLAKLKQLHDSGAIDAADYERERKALLDDH